MSIPAYPSDQLRFPELVSLLSSQNNLPSSIKVRNRLLTPWTISSPPKDWRETSSTLRDADLWSTISSSLGVYAFGSVPQAILKEQDKNRNGSSALTSSSNLWAIAILSPPLHQDHRAHAPRLDLWISSETSLSSGSTRENLEKETEQKIVLEEERLLDFIINQWLVSQIDSGTEQDSLEDQDQISNQIVATKGKTKDKVVLCGLEQRLVDLIQSWSTADPKGQNRIQVNWVNSCLVYMRSGVSESTVIQEGLIDGRWKVGKIEESDIDLVQRNNKLPFPTEYIRKHLAHSVLLRDSQSSTSASFSSSSDAETSRTDDHPVGWVYTHDDLSLASLQVLEPYRRFSSASSTWKTPSLSETSKDGQVLETEPKQRQLGIGSHILNLVTPKVVEAQQFALAQAGVLSSRAQPRPESQASKDCPSQLQSKDPVPCFAVTEVSNQGARKFFERNGFRSVQKSAWVGIRL